MSYHIHFLILNNNDITLRLFAHLFINYKITGCMLAAHHSMCIHILIEF